MMKSKTTIQCSICGQEAEFAIRQWQDKNKIWHCEHDKVDIGAPDKMENARKENRELSREARKMAMEAQATENAANPDISLAPIDVAGERGQFGNQPLNVKKKLIDSLNEKNPYK